MTVIEEAFRTNKHRIIKISLNHQNGYAIQFKGVIFRVKIFGKYLLGDHWDCIENSRDEIVLFPSYEDAYSFYEANHMSTISMLNAANEIR